MAWKLYDVPGYDRPLRLSPEHAAALLAEGVPEPDVNRPAPRAPKPEWVDYAADQGMDPGEAEAHTKAYLVERFG